MEQATQTKSQRKTEIASVAAKVAAEMSKGIDAERELQDDGKMQKTNRDGKMLMCEFTLQKGVGMPDPLCITINEEFRWIKRGAKVIVPWYLVEHMKNNIERKFRQEVDPLTGKKIVTWDDMPSESFSYMPIDPAPGVTL